MISTASPDSLHLLPQCHLPVAGKFGPSQYPSVLLFIVTSTIPVVLRVVLDAAPILALSDRLALWPSSCQLNLSWVPREGGCPWSTCFSDKRWPTQLDIPCTFTRLPSFSWSGNTALEEQWPSYTGQIKARMGEPIHWGTWVSADKPGRLYLSHTASIPGVIAWEKEAPII